MRIDRVPSEKPAEPPGASAGQADADAGVQRGRGCGSDINIVHDGYTFGQKQLFYMASTNIRILCGAHF